jgi:hypothetical protein
MIKITVNQYPDIIKAYRDNSVPMIDLAKQYNVTRQNIFYILRLNGVDTSKQNAGNVKCNCANCGKAITKQRKVYKRAINTFCSRPCFYAYLNNSNKLPYIDSGKGRREARKVVALFFKMSKGNIVHHEDRNQLHNNKENLKVFASSADHLRYHRGADVIPLWSGC